MRRILLLVLCAGCVWADTVVRQGNTTIGPVTSINLEADAGLFVYRPTGTTKAVLKCVPASGVEAGCVYPGDQDFGIGQRSYSIDDGGFAINVSGGNIYAEGYIWSNGGLLDTSSTGSTFSSGHLYSTVWGGSLCSGAGARWTLDDESAVCGGDRLLDLKANGTVRFSVESDGVVSAPGVDAGSVVANDIRAGGALGTGSGGFYGPGAGRVGAYFNGEDCGGGLCGIVGWNISLISKTGAGRYTVDFAPAMANGYYMVNATVANSQRLDGGRGTSIWTKRVSTTEFLIGCEDTTGTAVDCAVDFMAFDRL